MRGSVPRTQKGSLHVRSHIRSRPNLFRYTFSNLATHKTRPCTASWQIRKFVRGSTKSNIFFECLCKNLLTHKLHRAAGDQTCTRHLVWGPLLRISCTTRNTYALVLCTRIRQQTDTNFNISQCTKTDLKRTVTRNSFRHTSGVVLSVEMCSERGGPFFAVPPHRAIWSQKPYIDPYVAHYMLHAPVTTPSAVGTHQVFSLKKIIATNWTVGLLRFSPAKT